MGERHADAQWRSTLHRMAKRTRDDTYSERESDEELKESGVAHGAGSHVSRCHMFTGSGAPRRRRAARTRRPPPDTPGCTRPRIAVHREPRVWAWPWGHARDAHAKHRYNDPPRLSVSRRRQHPSPSSQYLHKHTAFKQGIGGIRSTSPDPFGHDDEPMRKRLAREIRDFDSPASMGDNWRVA